MFLQLMYASSDWSGCNDYASFNHFLVSDIIQRMFINNDTVTMNEEKILQRIKQLELFAGLIINEAAMLKQELSGVVSDSSPKKGKLPDSEIFNILNNRNKKRVKG